MYSFSGKLRYSECDAEGRMTFLSMINYLQDASTFQCEELGIGVEFMRERNKAWFLAAWNIFVPELPVFGADPVDAVGGHAEVHLGPALPQKIGHAVQVPGPHRHHFHALGYAVRSISVDCRTRPTDYISDTHPC